MKKLLLIIAFIFGATSFIQAQGSDSESRPARQQMDVSEIIDSRIEDLTSRLSLTSNQVTQVRAIYEKTLGAQMNSRNNGESADQTQSTTEQRHNEIMTLLNADQKKIYSQYLEESDQQAQERRGVASSGRQMDSSGMIDSRVEDLTTRLSLTRDQVTQVRAIYEKTMGTQTRTGNNSEPSTRAQSSSEQRHNEIMTLLNADQKKIYEAYLNEREQ